MPGPEVGRALVVGAGLAGLAAADELARSGVECTILEARERVGGRVHSRELPNGAVIEMGAEFILPGGDEILGLVERFGLDLWDKGMRYGTREPRGVEVSAGALREAAELIDAELERGVEGRSASAVLAGIEIDPGARAAILARAEVSAAAPADLVPAAELGSLARLSDDPAPSVAGGNQAIAMALAAELGDRIRLADPVRELGWDESGVVARTGSGEVTAGACIVAVPVPALDGIAFDPPLPDDRLRALGSIGYGHAAKLFVPLTVPAPPSATLAVPDRYWAWTATGAGDRPQPVVSVFAGSTTALERLRIDQGPEAWLAKLETLRPDLELDSAGALLSTWHDDPWARAAYSLEPDASTREAIAAPLGPLRFAGEHLAPQFSGLMEGAVRSGREAAASLLEGPSAELRRDDGRGSALGRRGGPG